VRNRTAAGGVGMRVEEDKVKRSTAVLFFQSDDLPAEILAKAAEVRRLLRLGDGQQQFELTYSPMRGGDGELAVNSRSLLQILQAFASYVEVPEQHLREGRTARAFENVTEEQRSIGRIRSGPEKPDGAYAAIRYRGNWLLGERRGQTGRRRPPAAGGSTRPIE
jgi:hypothetical protein